MTSLEFVTLRECGCPSPRSSATGQCRSEATALRKPMPRRGGPPGFGMRRKGKVEIPKPLRPQPAQAREPYLLCPAEQHHPGRADHRLHLAAPPRPEWATEEDFADSVDFSMSFVMPDQPWWVTIVFADGIGGDLFEAHQMVSGTKDDFCCSFVNNIYCIMVVPGNGPIHPHNR